ncbi:MAG: toxin-antitoxin system COG1487 family toxin component [Algoriphagus marincola HL-49]|uniref:Toxin-antitoxin system COG1487 family toxin component n=1 Tax=Algoriphagus marincola HL-49 TaxID=1305737 RepID=A0A0N8KGB8_9BACT|nr:MAG: toxin-antitoxin system COG1487 family toxin component [Algoriphagus marincola HL-49]
MPSPKILVDSSVWIDFFKYSRTSPLEAYLQEDIIVTNDIILTELIPKLHHEKRTEIIEGLEALEKVKLDIDWELIRHLQKLNLKNGINKVGIPDLIIINQVIEENLTLYSKDKHFRLMQTILKFELIS